MSDAVQSIHSAERDSGSALSQQVDWSDCQLAVRSTLLAARLEFYDLCWLTRALRGYLLRHELDFDRIAPSVGGMTAIEVVDCGNRRFDWAARGESFLAFVCEVLAEDRKTTIDLVAWPLDRPEIVLSMFGRAAWLGAWNAWDPATYSMGKPLIVHRSPLEWLKAGCTGAVIVEPRLAARDLLDLPGPVAARDRAHGLELLEMMEALLDRSRILVQSRSAGAGV